MDETKAIRLLEELIARGEITVSDVASVTETLIRRGESATSTRVLEELAGRQAFSTAKTSSEEPWDAAHTLNLRARAEPGEGEPSLAGDRFQNVEPLGSGGMGQVFKAFDTLLQRPVAIKVLRASGSLPALLAEAQAQARVEHEHICPIYDVGRHGNRGFVVMRLVPGKSLSAYVGQLSAEEVARLGAQVARALHAAHRRGLVHRDVKPANILVEPGEGGLKASVVDFGLSTQGEGMMAGTPGYLAPEVVREGRAGPEADVFGLGATLYHLLVGTPPQQTYSFLELLEMLRAGKWQPPAMPLDKVPRDLGWVLRKALAPEPGDRYRSAQELADDLERVLRGEPVLAQPRKWSYRMRAAWFHWRRRVVVGAVVGVAVVSLAVALSVVWRQSRQAALISDLQAKVLGLDERFRGVLTRPPHDIRSEREKLRQAAEEAAAQAEAAGLASESLSVLMARAYLALGLSERALEVLEKLADARRAPAGVKPLMAAALLERWQEEWAQVAQLPAGELRRRREESLRERYRQRALSLLREISSEAQGSLAEARLAFLEGRWEDAVALAQAARGATPWVYELELLCGEAKLAAARDLFSRGEYHGSAEMLREAQGHFRRAVDLAPSHPKAYLGLAQALFEEANCLAETGGEPEALWEKAATVAQTSLTVDGGEPRTLYLLSMAHLHSADFAYRRGRREQAARELEAVTRWADELTRRAPHRSWGYTFQGIAWRIRAEAFPEHPEAPQWEAQAAASLEEALRRDPVDLLAGNNLGLLHWQRGLTRFQAGEDPEPFLAHAQELFQNLVVTARTGTLLVNLSAVAASRVHTALFLLTEPTAPLGVAEEAIRQALATNPADTIALNNLALLRIEQAQREILRGGEPEPFLREAEALTQRVETINPKDPVLPDNWLRLIALSLQPLASGEKAGEELLRQADALRARVTDWPENVEAQLWWAACLWEGARWQRGHRAREWMARAWRAWSEAQRLRPHHPDLWLLWIAWKRNGAGLWALEDRQHLEKLQSSPFPLLRRLAEALARQGSGGSRSDRGALLALAPWLEEGERQAFSPR